MKVLVQNMFSIVSVDFSWMVYYVFLSKYCRNKSSHFGRLKYSLNRRANYGYLGYYFIFDGDINMRNLNNTCKCNVKEQ